jgi:MFS family permease
MTPLAPPAAQPPWWRLPHGPLLACLYAAQGLPFGFFTLALPVLLREQGWSLKALSLLQFLALPWALKFLWAPWLDARGHPRQWLLGLQGGAAALALLMAVWQPGPDSVALLVAVLLFNALAATQDVVTDGLAVRLLDGQQRSLANALQVGAYRVGMILGGGGLMWLLAQVGSGWMYGAMALALALTLWPVWRLPSTGLKPAVEPHQVDSRREHVPAAWWWGWWRRLCSPPVRTMAILIVLYRLGDQMVGSLVMPFMADLHVPKATMALIKGVAGSGTSLVGAVLGGWFMWRFGRRAALWWTGLAQALAFALYVAVAAGWGGLPSLWAVTVLEGVAGTMATVALFALMMDVCEPDHAGTDYTVLASVVVLVGGLANLVAGALGDALGYTATFTVGMGLSLLGVGAVVHWLDHHPVHPRVHEVWRP